MNEKNPEEIRYRRLAVQLFDKGKSPAAILAIIPRSRSWLFKWKKRFEQQGRPALDSLPKAPHHSPQSYSFAVVKLVVRVRKRLEQSVAGHVGPRAIQQELVQGRLLNPPPGLTTIKRWLKEAGVLDSPAESDKAAYYPEPQLGEAGVIFACDWTERYFTGGEKVFVFHTIDLRTHALVQTLRPDKSTESAWEHLLACGAQLGLPDLLQMDNDAAFTGLGRTPHAFGRFVRLALYLGIEPLFIPPAEPERNHVVERVHGTWAASFWNKNHFASSRALERKSPQFLLWYKTYAPPALGGLTVKQAATQLRCPKLLRRQLAQIPDELPLTAGRLHFLRKVDAQGNITILKEHWRASKTLIGHYIWATLDIRKAALFLYHRRSERARPRLIKHYVYEIKEKVHKLKPEFHRRARKVDILQII
jgi:Homeodomain-like domain